MITKHIQQIYAMYIRWGVSRGRDSYGYTTCVLSVDGQRVAGCNGGGYDMRGTVIGNWMAARFAARLRTLKGKRMPDGKLYGLSYVNPKFDPGKARVPGTEETVEQQEAAGKSLGLERYRAFHLAATDTPDRLHTVPMIDGACGINSVERIGEAIGLRFQRLGDTRKRDVWICRDYWKDSKPKNQQETP